MAIGQLMPLSAGLPRLQLSYLTQAAQDGVDPIQWPSGIQAGDLAIGIAVRAPGGTVATIGFDGFTDIVRQVSAQGDGGVALQARILNGTETGDLTGTVINTNTSSKGLRIYRGNRSVASFSAAGTSIYFANGTPSATATYSGTGLLPVVSVAAIWVETTRGSSSFSPDPVDGISTTRMLYDSQFYDQPMPTQYATTTDRGSNNLALAAFIEVN